MRALHAALLLASLACPLPALAGDGKEPPKKGGDGGKPPAAKAPPRDEPKRPAVGDEVKDLSLELAAGGSWRVAAARGKGAVLVFAADWSKESLDALKRLGDPKSKIASTGAEVLGILREADAEKARRVAKDEGIEAPIAVDPKRKAYDRFAKSGLPWTVVIDRDGKLASSSAGFDAEAVAKTLEPPRK